MVPDIAAQVVGTVVQIAAGTAREIQMRSRSNAYLDLVNQQIFMPRGLFAMVMAFKDDVSGQQRGPLSRVARSVGTLVAAEKLDINQTVAKFSNPDPNLSGMRRNMQNLRVASGTTVGQLELPQAADLVYPDLDRAVKQNLETDANGKGKSAFKDKMSGGMSWMQDYLDRRERALYVSKCSSFVMSSPHVVRQARSTPLNEEANVSTRVAKKPRRQPMLCQVSGRNFMQDF
jgi:hypothetical protein